MQDYTALCSICLLCVIHLLSISYPLSNIDYKNASGDINYNQVGNEWLLSVHTENYIMTMVFKMLQQT